jgi:4-diphosphocytidyl-2-C-methyl-D-erythritol kinase
MTRRKVVRRQAHAKVNLFLRVLGARSDGYHDLESLVLPVSLADRVTTREAAALKVMVKGEEPIAAEVPAGGLNLALVAALALADECPDAGGAEVEIDKRIPVAGGMGGGSADAAAALWALNELWGCGLDARALTQVAARVGSDVPAMLSGSPVRVRGRGEVIEAVSVERLWWVLVSFDFGVRSPDAYRWWDEDRSSTGPDPSGLCDAAARGDVDALGPLLFNDLEAPVFARHPQIEETKSMVLDAGAAGAVMAGSGSSVAGLARDQEHARALARGFPGSRIASGPP